MSQSGQQAGNLRASLCQGAAVRQQSSPWDARCCPGSFCAWSKAVLGCEERPSPCSLPQDANSTDISLLLAAAYLIFMHPSALECPNSLCAQKSGALPRYFAVCVSFPPFSPLHWALQRCCHWVGLFSCMGWEQAPSWCRGVSSSPPSASPRHRGRDALVGFHHLSSLCQAMEIS